MSEYQYYEFLAIDRPLTAAQQAAVRAISSRADISATSFVNAYHWGDFKGDVHDFLRRYYDAHLYLANWGTRRFAFRLPKDLVDRDAIEAYANDSSLDVKPAGDWLLVDISPNDGGDGGDWDNDEGHGWMASLAASRAEVLAGDLRPLYVAWLAGVQIYGPLSAGRDDDDDESDSAGDNDDEAVPPVPPGMGQLSAAQRAMADFFGVDDALLEVAAIGSPPSPPSTDLAAALAAVPAAQRDRWLLDLVAGDDPLAVARVRRQLVANTAVAKPAASGRTVRQLREAWGELQGRRRRERVKADAEAKRKKDATAAAERERHLSDLAGRLPGAWKDVDLLIDQRNRHSYDQAAQLLLDLKAVADRPGGDPAGFQRQLQHRLSDHRRRPNFIAAVRKLGLVP